MDANLWLDRYRGWMLLLGLLNCFCLSFMSHMHVMFMKSVQWLCTCNIVFSIMKISHSHRAGQPTGPSSHLQPSLSHEGYICLGTKSDTIGILESLLESTREHSLNFDAVLYDGAALVNILQPKTCNAFNQYATEIFCPVILKEMTEVRCTRLDIV